MDNTTIRITLTLSELRTIIDTINSYRALHICSDYEVEEAAEKLENMLTAFEAVAYD